MVGYWWYEGDTISLDFDIDGEIIADQEFIEEVNGEPTTVIKPVRVPVEDLRSKNCKIIKSSMGLSVSIRKLM